MWIFILGQSAATAASMALAEGIAVQEVHYGRLRERLRADGQVLEMPPVAPKRSAELESGI